MAIPLQEIGEIATAGIAVGAGAMKAIHEIFGQERVTKKDLADILGKLQPVNGSTPLTKDAHAVLCAANAKELAATLETKFGDVYRKIDDRFDMMIEIITNK
jgi:hypothetical protein